MVSFWKQLERAKLILVDDFVKSASVPGYLRVSLLSIGALWDAIRQRDDLEFFRVTGSKVLSLNLVHY